MPLLTATRPAASPPVEAIGGGAGNIGQALEAREAARAIATLQAGASMSFTDERGVSVQMRLPREILNFLAAALDEMARGRQVIIIPSAMDLTIEQTAALLRVSRSYVLALPEQGAIPLHGSGDECRLRAGDVQAFRSRLDADREAALDELVREGQDLNLGYDP